ncbi:MAG: Hpt domain-containing protein [Hahellaceae bacterium]|nr:Hpt domain-containing protein [Hahellaceae bacterium]
MTDNVTHVDLNALAELKEVMEEEFTILLETYLNDSLDRIEQLKSAYAAGDADAFSRAAHSFKGSSNNLGVVLLAQYCQEAETQSKGGDLSQGQQLIEKIENEFEIVTQQLQAHLGL